MENRYVFWDDKGERYVAILAPYRTAVQLYVIAKATANVLQQEGKLAAVDEFDGMVSVLKDRPSVFTTSVLRLIPAKGLLTGFEVETGTKNDIM